MSQWKQIPFSNALRALPVKNKIKNSEILPAGRTPVIDQSEKLVAGFTNSPAFYTDPPYIIFGDHTRCVKYADFSFNPGADGVKILKVKDENYDTKFVLEYLRFTPIQNLGYSRHFKLLKEITIPLPPLEEQQRIAKLLKNCNKSIQSCNRKIKLLRDLRNMQFIQDTASDKVCLGDLITIRSGQINPTSAEYRNQLHVAPDSIQAHNSTFNEIRTCAEDSVTSG